MIIEKIIFYKENNQIKTVVFYDDGTVDYQNYEKGLQSTTQYAAQHNYHSNEELANDNNVQMWTEEVFKKNIDAMAAYHAQTHRKKQSKQKKTKNPHPTPHPKPKKRKPSIISKIKTAFDSLKRKTIKGIIGLIVAVVTFGLVAAKKPAFTSIWNNFINKITGTDKDEDKDKDKEVSKEKEKEKNNKSAKSTTKNNFDDIYSALYHANMNQTKKNAVTSIWNYINHYNQIVAKDHLSKRSNTKLGLQWDEVTACYLGYNNLSESQLVKIFDFYDFDAEKMIKAYKRAYKQEVLAHTIQKTELGKDELIKSQEGKKFYRKYERILNYFNTTKSTKRIEYAEEFYKNLKKDFNFNNKNLSADKHYKLSILPMIEAMNNLTRNIDLNHKLTKSQVKYFKNLSNGKMVAAKFQEVEKTLSNYRIAAKAVNEESEEISYNTLKKLGIKELKDQNAYNVANEKDRNIKDHKEYKENMQYKHTSSKGEKQQNKNRNKNASTSTNTNNHSNENETTSKKTSTKNNKKDKKQTNTKPSKSKNSKPIKNKPSNNHSDDYYNIDPDTPEKDTSTEVETDSSYVSNNSVKDTTTNSAGAVNKDDALPDPNLDTEDSDSLITIKYNEPYNISNESDLEINITGINLSQFRKEQKYKTINSSRKEAQEAVATQIVDAIANASYSINTNASGLQTK